MKARKLLLSALDIILTISVLSACDIGDDNETGQIVNNQTSELISSQLFFHFAFCQNQQAI